ncbi:MAG: hypothetical protein EOP45_08935, partial [Sphingobacteriaceae bacterium]
MRFSWAVDLEDLRYRISTKRQKPGEFTLRFIDQFMVLISRLPGNISDEQAIKYILKGIRTDVARMARAAHIKTVEDLAIFVKENYGQNDKLETSTFSKNFKSVRTPNHHVEEWNEEYSDHSERESDDDFELNEVSKHNKYRDKKVNQHQSSQNSRARVNQISNHENAVEYIAPSTSQGCTHTCSCAVVTQVNNERPSQSLSCPFCDGKHSYKDCPLPPHRKPRHCFYCKSPEHLAPECPSNSKQVGRPADQTNANKIIRQPVQSQTVAKLHKNTVNNNSSPQISSMVDIMQEKPDEKFMYLNYLGQKSDKYIPPAVAYIESLIYFPKYDLRPHATVKVSDIDLSGLLDTGAHVTVMGQNLYESIDWKVELLAYDTSIITADGTRHRVLGILLLEYELNNKKRIVPTLVVPVVMKKLIFGMDFQRIFGIGLTFLETNAIEIEPVKEDKVMNSHDLTAAQKSLLDSVVLKLPSVSEEGPLNCTNKIVHNIDTGISKPVYQKPYIYSPKLQDKIRTEINRLLERGIIKRVSESSWLNAVVPVPKPDGVVRLCIDARKLNAITKKNRYSQMNLERIFARIGKARYFSSIDLKDAFYQIPLREEDQVKTAFSIHGMGIFAYQRMPMGLVNSAATLCRLVETVFNCSTEPEIFAYIDDFIVCTDTFERHIEILEMIANKLNEAGLQIGLKKSKFCMKRLKFLGHMIDEQEVSIDESRVQAIKDYKRPTTVREIQSFLGLTGWHRKFVEGFSDLAAPLVNLTKKDRKF